MHVARVTTDDANVRHTNAATFQRSVVWLYKMGGIDANTALVNDWLNTTNLAWTAICKCTYSSYFASRRVVVQAMDRLTAGSVFNSVVAPVCVSVVCLSCSGSEF